MCVFLICGFLMFIGVFEDILMILILIVLWEWIGCENWGISLLLKLCEVVYLKKGWKVVWRFVLKESDWVRVFNLYMLFDKDVLIKVDNKWCYILYI